MRAGGELARGLNLGLVHRIRDRASTYEKLARPAVEHSATHREQCYAELTSEGSTMTAQSDSNATESKHLYGIGSKAAIPGRGQCRIVKDRPAVKRRPSLGRVATV